MNATTVTLDAVQQTAAPVDHAALDAILTHLERRYGHDPRIDRAYRIVVSDRVDLSVVDSRAGLVQGDSGRSYWATVDGFCECPDAERVARCKHALAVLIAVQLAASHWFYLYVVWFLPLVLVALLAPLAVRREALGPGLGLDARDVDDLREQPVPPR